MPELAEAIDSPALGIDLEGRVAAWTRMAAELSGHPAQEAPANNFVEACVAVEHRERVAGVFREGLPG